MINIFIPVHGQPALLQQCLQSVRKYTTQCEIWVYDNASPNGAEIQRISKAAQAEYIRSDVNRGFIKPCNEMAAKAVSPYFCFMNSDVIIDGRWQEHAIAALNDTVRLVGRDARMMYKSGYTSQLNPEKYNYLEASFWMMHRKTYGQFGLFDDTHLHFAYVEDVEYCLRLQQAGYQIKQLNLPVTHLRNRTRNSLDATTRAYLKQCWQDNKAWVLHKYAAQMPILE